MVSALLILVVAAMCGVSESSPKGEVPAGSVMVGRAVAVPKTS